MRADRFRSCVALLAVAALAPVVGSIGTSSPAFAVGPSVALTPNGRSASLVFATGVRSVP